MKNRLIELRTFQDLAHGTEPTLATTGFASTKWNYNPQRGWLDNKRYDDNKGTDYTYTAAGRLKTRTWSRGTVTAYSYDQGQMVGTDYSDATQDVVYTYDNFGRPTLVTQAVGVVAGTHNAATQNQHAYIYDPATLVLDKETISYASGLSRSLDRSQDNLLRPSGFQLMNGTVEEHATSYGYDAAGRLSQVAASYPLPATPDFTYNYLTNSGSLLESVTGPAHTISNTYETTRNVLQQKRNTAGDLSQITNTPISNFVYGVNALGQRDDVARTGSAFTTANTETWNYNAKGEVVTVNHSANNAFDRSYEFDGIGNRKKSADSITLPTTDNYQANALNQYGSIDGNTRSFDDDGNLTDDGTKQYVWDGENRLIAVKQGSTTIAEYSYDYQSRRISKTVGANVKSFVYDGWNPIAEFTSALSPLSFTLSTSYTWGMDLSGSMQGAGGVGGLLSVKDGSETYYPTYDGNGNVSEYVDSTGAVVAHYEYDAFGQVVGSGTKANDFTHQFSTKQLDSESGLNYYGYRYYDSSTGSWVSRDPIKERGGINLYGFVENKTTGTVDYLGKAPLGGIGVGGSAGFFSAIAGVEISASVTYSLCDVCTSGTATFRAGAGFSGHAAVGVAFEGAGNRESGTTENTGSGVVIGGGLGGAASVDDNSTIVNAVGPVVGYNAETRVSLQCKGCAKYKDHYYVPSIAQLASMNEFVKNCKDHVSRWLLTNQ